MNRGSGKFPAYRIEVRWSGDRPTTVLGLVMDGEWREMEPREGAPGVPISGIHEPFLLATDCLTYPAAQALRWWFHASAEAENTGICLETRLVEYEVSYSVDTERKDEHCQISSEDRSNIMPNWGKEKE